MKILLISPTIDNIVRYNKSGWDIEQDDFGKFPPLGLLYIIASIKNKYDHEIKLIDSVGEGLTHAQIEEIISQFKPDLVGISCCTVVLYDCVLIARTVRRLAPGAHISFGGPQVNDFPEETIGLPEVDSIITGYGEYVFAELVEALDRKRSINDIPFVYTKENIGPGQEFKYATIENLDEVPFPDRSYLKRNQYFSSVGYSKTEFTPIITSRGCPMKCTFCATFHKDFRARSVPNVIEEIELILKDGYKEIFFQDDTFNLNKNRAKEFCREVILKNLKFTWSYKARVNAFDEELVELSAQAGCHQIHVGVETGTQEGLNYLKKGISIKQIKDAFGWMNKYKIRSIADFMIGLPFERTERDIFQNVKILYELKPTYAQFNILQPFPKTEIFCQGEAKGLFAEKRWTDWMKNIHPDFEKDIWEEYFTREELSAILKKVYHRFYFRPSYIFKAVCSVKNMDDLQRKIQGVKTLLKNPFNGRKGVKSENSVNCWHSA